MREKKGQARLRGSIVSGVFFLHQPPAYCTSGAPLLFTFDLATLFLPFPYNNLPTAESPRNALSHFVLILEEFDYEQ
jgi:hypothetical protein